MEAIIKTKSNFKNCNGKRLVVTKCNGSFITCLVPANGFTETGQPQGQMVSADFTIKEIESLFN